MELRDYLRVLRRGWPLVLACIVLCTAAGVGITLATTNIYQASVQLFVATNGTSDPTQLAQGNQFAQAQVQSYTSIATDPRVTGPVVQKLGLKMSAKDLADTISADAPQNQVLINLHVTNQSPQLAARLANTVAAQFAEVVQSTAQTSHSGVPVVKLTVIHPATVPSSPIKPNKLLDIGLGFVIGLLVGVGVVVLRDVLDNTVKGPQDFEELDVPVLGMVPFDKRTDREPIAFRADAHGARAEAYRQLRTSLQFVNVDEAPRIISITSAIPGEGKTTTAINLAAALAEAGFRVCLIEADLRRPTIAKSLGLVSEVGFTTLLIGKAKLENVLQNAGRNLAVLTSGPVPPNPSELLVSEQASSVIRHIAEMVDFTIIDSAPLLPVADGAEVAAIADATLVVHHAGKTTREQAAQSIETLEKVGERPVGVVLNMVARGRGYTDGYYYYAYRPDRRRKPGGGGAIKVADLINDRRPEDGRMRPHPEHVEEHEPAARRD